MTMSRTAFFMSLVLAMWLNQASSHGLQANSSSLRERFDELVGLAELPMDRLLAVKRSLEPDFEDHFTDPASEELPEAQALTGSKPPVRVQDRGDHEPWDSANTKSNTITTIFSTTITALAFIAFAAYLICMIIVAVQNTNNGGQATMFVQGAPTAQIVQGRRKREVREVGWVGVDQAGMYRALIMLSEGYAMYHKAHVRRV